MKRTETDCSKE